MYSIDTSAFLDGWVRHYPPDVIPGLWEKLDELIERNILIASEEVLYDLEKKEDDIYKWVKKREKMFIPTDENIQKAVAEILKHNKKLVDTRKNRSGSDPFVIAVAKIHTCKVITAEIATNTPDRPHIPDVCSAIGVPSISLLTLCREQNWSFGFHS